MSLSFISDFDTVDARLKKTLTSAEETTSTWRTHALTQVVGKQDLVR